MRKLFLIIMVTLLFHGCGPKRRVRIEPEIIIPPPVQSTDNALDIYYTARKNHEAGQLDAAAEKYHAYLDTTNMHNYSADAWLALANIAETLENPADTARYYKTFIDRFPGDRRYFPARDKLMTVYLQTARFSDLFAVAPNPGLPAEIIFENTVGFALLGDAKRKNGQYDVAANAYAAALSAAGNNGAEEITGKLLSVLENLTSGDVLSLMDRFETDPPQSDLMYALGTAFIREGNLANADTVLKSFLELYPFHGKRVEAETKLAEIGMDTGKNSETVGIALPLSGRLERFGEKALHGIELAASQFNRQYPESPVSLIIQDTASEQAMVISVIDQLADAGALAVLGPLSGTLDAAFEAQNRQIPIVLFTQRHDAAGIGAWVFRHFITPKLQVASLLDYAMVESGYTRFAVLYPEEKYGRTFRDIFVHAVNNAGGEVIGMAAYDPEDTDFAKPIREIKNAAYVRKARLEAVFIPDAPSKVGLIAPQLVFHDLRPTLLGTNLWHSPRLIKMARRYLGRAVIPDGFFAESEHPSAVQFTNDFQNAYGAAPGFMEAMAYDTAMMIFTQIRKGATNRVSLQESLLGIRHFQGVTGTTSFDHQGDAQKKMFLLKIKDGEFREIKHPYE